MVVEVKNVPAIGFVSFVLLITCLVVGFFGGEQQLQNIYPEHAGLIHFIAEMIRIAFWILVAIVLIVVGLYIAAIIFANKKF